MSEKREKKEVPVEIRAAFDLRKRGKIGEAKAAFERALALHPSHAKAWWLLGGIWWDAHEYDNAVRCFARASAMKPRNEDCSAGLFHALIDGGRYGEALVEARRFLAEVATGAKCSDETRAAYSDLIADPEGTARAWSHATLN